MKKDKRPPVRIQLRRNDQVEVIAGKDKGDRGRVLDVNTKTGRVIVDKVNLIKRHTRKNPAKQIAGGIAEKEAPIAVSNVMILCGKCDKPVRIKHHLVPVAGGKTKSQRVCHKCGGSLDKK
ncbi:MAG: 50S ribosomal protein L24 [Acidobacteriota bacterium]|nr:50S ribosomal protein L24 [Acidobacteriota bacterium]